MNAVTMSKEGAATLRRVLAEATAVNRLAAQYGEKGAPEIYRLQVALSESQATVTRLIAQAEGMAGALERARDQFLEYQRQHLAKSPPDLAKAATNRRHAELLSSALATYRSAKA